MRKDFFIPLIFFISLTCPLSAEEGIPVKIKAETLKYFEDSNRFEASGSVEVKIKGVTIYADHLLMDSATNLATAEGRVRLVADSYSANAGALLYDANNETADYFDFTSQALSRKVKGKLYFTSRHLKDFKDKMEGEKGSVTTCDETFSHYFVVADKVEYYPEERIIGKNVVMYEGELPVMWMPYFVYDLTRKRRKNWVFGHNQVEGDYLKTAWDYPGGLFLLDYMQKKGWGTGVDTNYSSALGGGALYLYLLDEKDTKLNTRIEKISHEKNLDPQTTFKLNQSYISTYLLPSGRIDQTSLGWQLNHTGERRWNWNTNILDDRLAGTQRNALQFNLSSGNHSASYNLNYDFAKNSPRWINENQRLSFRTPLWSDKVYLSSNTNYYYNLPKEGDAGEEKIEPQIEVAGAETNFSWVYRQNWFLDLRSGLSPGVPRYDFLEKQPEVEIYPQALDLKLFNLKSTLGYGRYREVKYVPLLGKKRDFTNQRFRSSLNASRSLPLGWGSALYLAANLDQFSYSAGDQLYAYSENGNLRTELWSFFRNEVSYRKAYTNGNSPFFFDKLGTSYHDGREKMTFYYLNKFNWSLESGKNWQTDKWLDVMTNLMVAPDPALRWTVNTGWDIENRQYKDLVTGLHLVPHDSLAIDFSARQDMNIGQLRQASALYDLYLLKGQPNQTQLRFSQVFDAFTKEFKVRDIMVIRQLHCWEMRFTYSDYRKEYSFTFGLKAIPDEPVGFSSGRGFYFDEFERSMQQLNPQGEVRRY
jgi:hypothetical protein